MGLYKVRVKGRKRWINVKASSAKGAVYSFLRKTKR